MQEVDGYVLLNWDNKKQVFLNEFRLEQYRMKTDWKSLVN